MARGTFYTEVIFNNYIIASELAVELIYQGMRAIMFQVRADARSRAPQKGRIDDGRKSDLATSTLTKSIFFRNIEGAVFELYTSAENAVWNEFGTKDMSAVPFMFPATIAAGPRINAMAAAAMVQGFK